MLNSIWGKVKSVGSAIKNTVSAVRSKARASLPHNQIAGASMTFPIGEGLTGSQTRSAYEAVGRTRNPGASGSWAPTPKENSPTTIDAQGNYSSTYSTRPSTYTGSAGGSSNQTGQTQGGSTSSWSAPVDSLGRTSTSTSGTPFFDANGNYVVPKAGFGGMTGFGGSGFTTANSTPMTGLSGLQGTDNARGFTGAGAGTTSATFGQTSSDEEARKKKEQGGSTTITPNPTQQAVNAMTAQGSENPIQAPPVPDTIDAGWISKVQETMNATKNSGIPEQDKQTIYAQLQTNLMNAKTKLDQANPIPENPVEDTQEQLEFIQQSEDPFGVKSMVDQFRAEQTNLGQLQTTRLELQKNISALNSAYQPIFKEIKENPNLPKALARRKIESLAVSQKEVLQGFLDQMDIVKQQISDQNEMVNRQFQIMTFATNQANQAQDNQRANLQLFISSGAVAGIADGELNSYAQRFGVTPKSLKSMKEAQLGKQEIITQEFADGSLKGVDKKTGKVIWSTSGAGKVTSDTTFGTETVNGQRVRYSYDAQGNVVGQTVLGSAGENSTADKKSLFLEYLATDPSVKTKTRKALENEAIAAGLGTSDKDIAGAIQRFKTDEWGFWR